MKILVILATVTFMATLAMNTNGEGYEIWSLPLNNLLHSAPLHVSSHSLEAISGIPLCK